MKNALIGLLVLSIFGCTTSTNKESAGSDVSKVDSMSVDEKEYTDLEAYYFPLSDSLEPTTYTYEVHTRSKEMKDDHYYEYLKFNRTPEGNYAFTRFEKSLNMIDSMVFELDDAGANVASHYIKTQDQSFVKVDVSPKLLYPWKREVDARMTNSFRYNTYVNGQETKTSIRVNSGFVGFIDVSNVFSKERACAKIVHQTQAKFKFFSPPKEVTYTSKGENLNLVGIGLYKSIEMNNHGDTIIKKLVDIKRN